ncbi:MAG: type IX secretion system outer membrane channel protein PorV [Bacteroidia bacterium]|nr:type IX secretion system outer membrane channel protein PorV [Bacteroidia bacterium]
MKKSLFAIALVGLLLAAPAWTAAQTTGQTRGTKTITTAVPFLLVAPDSRSGGMGEVGVALANDANAMHWNPAALGFIDSRMGFSLSYSPWLRALGIPDINLMYLSGYYNTGTKGVVGASLRYFSLGSIQFTDNLGQPLGEGKPSEFAFDGGYALKITPVLSAAISLRVFNSQLASNANIQDPNARPVTSAAGDIGFFYKKDFNINGGSSLPAQFTSGVAISNIGPKVSYTGSTAERDFIPVNLRVGYAFKFFLDDYNSLTITNDFNKLLVPSLDARDKTLLQGMFGSFGDAEGGFGEEISEINTSIGMEYWYRELFAVRGGFFYEDPQKGNRKFINIGAGLKYNVFGINFAYLAPLQQNHPLQNTLRFTLTYNFDTSGAE